MLIIIPLKKLPQIFEQKCIRKPFDNQQIVKQKKKQFPSLFDKTFLGDFFRTIQRF
jgi:hypothetical protein